MKTNAVVNPKNSPRINNTFRLIIQNASSDPQSNLIRKFAFCRMRNVKKIIKNKFGRLQSPSFTVCRAESNLVHRKQSAGVQ